MTKYTCPCCGYKVFKEPPGSYDICPVCKWEDDVSQLKFVTSKGANHESLIDAQKSCKINQVQASKYNRDIEWRIFNLTHDKIEKLIEDHDYGMDYPKNLTNLYYWKTISKP